MASTAAPLRPMRARKRPIQEFLPASVWLGITLSDKLRATADAASDELPRDPRTSGSLHRS